MAQLLLIEDEPVLAGNVAIALRRAGHRVTVAGSATAARPYLTEAGFDLVLADISLGDGDGIELLAEHGETLGETPVVIMTGQDSTRNRSRAEGIAVSAFVAKPFALARLVEIVRALLAESVPDNARRGPSVMMYSHDTIGLGHMRRNSAIAEELVARVPGLSVLMLVGCPAGLVFAPRPGIDYIKLPSLTKIGRGHWQAGSLRIDAETTRALRAGILERVVETFRPDVFLADHEPAGVWDELVAPLTNLRKAGGTRLFLGLRDILDDPDRTVGAWAATGTDRVIADLYDEVLVYGNPGFYPSHTAYGLDRLCPGHVHYCGAVTKARRGQTRGWPGAPRKVLAAGGGGRDAFALLNAALSAVELIPLRRRPELTLVAGPLMDDELHATLAARAARAGVAFHSSVPDLPGLMAQTDLFLTMAGYNSVTEALALGCPTVVVPRVGPSAEQRIRAERLQALGLATVVWRHDLTPQRLAALMMTRPVPQRAGMTLDFNGAANAAALIARALEQASQTAQFKVARHA